MLNSVSRRVATFAAGSALLLGGCGDGSGPKPIDPDSIEGQITALFPAGPALRETALARIASVRQSLAQNNAAAARSQALSLVNFTLVSLREGRLTGGKSENTRASASRLINAVYQLASLTAPNIPDEALTDDGAAQIVGPEGGLVVTPSGVAGVQFPAGALPAEVLVTVTRIPAPPVPGTGPLPTTLKQYPPFYEYATTPAVLQFGDSARVGLCQVTDPANPLYPPEPHDRLRLAHALPGNQIEILERVGVNDFLRCTGITPNMQTEGPFGLSRVLKAIGATALEFLGPAPLYAAHGGLGGKVRSFSPFAAVDPTSGPVATITIDPPTSSLNAGRAIDLRAVTSDASGNEVTGRAITWSSSDTTLATVSPTGAVASVVGVFGGGPVTITAISEGRTATAVITVVRAPNAPNRVPGPTFPIVDLGANHGCALDSGGRAYCWGANQTGQLGDGTTTQRSVPTAVVMPAGVTFTSISAGGRFSTATSHTCALTPAGIAYCWGSTGFSIGDGTNIARPVPTQVSMPPGVTFASISTGAIHTCAVSSTGAGYCWGLNPIFGQMGDGTQLSRLAPVAVVMPPGVTFSAIAAGYFHSCAISPAGAAYCWGDNTNGPLGNGTVTSSLVPVPVTAPAGVTFTRIATGWHMSCAIAQSGVAYCWGLNNAGRVGDATSTQRTAPVPVVMPAGVSFSQIAVGHAHACALAISGAAYCWGDNAGTSQLGTASGALGDGTNITPLVPTPVLMPIGISFSSIFVGTSFSCGVSPAMVRYCWGANALGERGDGTTTP